MEKHNTIRKNRIKKKKSGHFRRLAQNMGKHNKETKISNKIKNKWN